MCEQNQIMPYDRKLRLYPWVTTFQIQRILNGGQLISEVDSVDGGWLNVMTRYAEQIH